MRIVQYRCLHRIFLLHKAPNAVFTTIYEDIWLFHIGSSNAPPCEPTLQEYWLGGQEEDQVHVLRARSIYRANGCI